MNKPIEELRAKSFEKMAVVKNILGTHGSENYQSVEFPYPVVKLSDAEEIINRQGWISVEDKLPGLSTPEKSNKVLIWFKDDISFGYCYSKDRWKVEGSNSNFADEIKLWMPLPEPPKQITGE